MRTSGSQHEPRPERRLCVRDLIPRSAPDGFLPRRHNPVPLDTGPLSRLLCGLVLAQWNPGYVFAFEYDWTVNCGLPARYGHWQGKPGAVHWVRPYPDQPLDAWLMWLTRQDLIDFMRIPA